jgi:hypothetical protein
VFVRSRQGGLCGNPSFPSFPANAHWQEIAVWRRKQKRKQQQVGIVRAAKKESEKHVKFPQANFLPLNAVLTDIQIEGPWGDMIHVQTFYVHAFPIKIAEKKTSSKKCLLY